jgi:rod shape-determining protein MreD
MRLITLNILRFFALILLQVFVINQINLGFLNTYISAVVYISFLLTFPTKVSKYFTLLVAFLLGIVIDIFLNTNGIHASACVLLAFVRPYLLERIQTDSPISEIQELTVFTEDLQKYILYTFILVFCFFFWLFILENFSFNNIFSVFLKTILSTLVSTILIIIGQYLLFRRLKN